jgi:hypothetical protein
MPETERLYNVRVVEPAGYRLGWSPDAQRIVLQFGDPDEFVTFGLTVELAASLAEALRAKAHEHRPKVGRDA